MGTELAFSRAAIEEALAVALASRAMIDELGGVDEGEALIRLVHARALEANGRDEEAMVAARSAAGWLADRQSRITPETARESFMRRVPDNVALAALAVALEDA